MTTPRIPRAELIERCRRQRARLASVTGSTIQRVHARDIGRALRIVRRVMKIIAHT